MWKRRFVEAKRGGGGFQENIYPWTLWHLGFPYPQGNQGTPYPPQPYRPGYPPTSGYPPYPSPAQPTYPVYPPSSSAGYPPPPSQGGYQQNTGYFSQVSFLCSKGGPGGKGPYIIIIYGHRWSYPSALYLTIRYQSRLVKSAISTDTNRKIDGLTPFSIWA